MKTINNVFNKVYPFLCGIFILAAVLLGKTNAKAQEPIDNTDEIKITFDIYIDNQKIESDNIVLEIANLNKEVYSKAIVTDNFNGFFKYNREYILRISTPGHCKKTIELSTYCPKSNYNLSINFNLTKDTPDQYMGKLAYNEEIKGFMKYEQ
mgnify:FL=1